MKKRTMPYGYEIRNGEITVNPKAEQIIKEIFKAYLDGMSFGNIADEMTCRGVDYYDGKKTWNKLMVKRILECRHYLGNSVEHDLTNEDIAEEIKKFVYANFQLKDRKNRLSPNALDIKCCKLVH